MKLTNDQIVELNDLIKQGYIRTAKHPIFPLTIYNYTPKAQYELKWTEMTRMCRGLVLDDDYNIVIKCPPKFFNRGEPLAEPVDLATARITEKLDGYYISIKVDSDYGLLITSRGSFTTKYVDAARYFITDPVLFKMAQNYTYFCELCQNFPEDEGIIATHHDTPRLVCWAMMDSHFQEEIPDDWCPFPVAQELSLGQAKEYLTQKVEGVVAQDLTTKARIKIKTDYFIKLHALISDCTPKRVWELLKDGSDIDSIEIPDELYPKMSAYREHLLNEFNIMFQHYQKIYELTKKMTDKDFALSDYNPVEKSAVFAIRKNKDVDSIIWREIKPLV